MDVQNAQTPSSSMQSDGPLLTVDNVHKRYGRTTAAAGVSFSVRPSRNASACHMAPKERAPMSRSIGGGPAQKGARYRSGFGGGAPLQNIAAI